MILFTYLLAASGLCCCVGFLWLQPVGSTLDCSVFIAVQLQCSSSPALLGFSPWLLFLRSAGSRCTGSVVVGRGLSCSAAWGIFLNQGLNHWITRKAPIEVLMSFSFPFIFCFFISCPTEHKKINLNKKPQWKGFSVRSFSQRANTTHAHRLPSSPVRLRNSHLCSLKFALGE